MAILLFVIGILDCTPNYVNRPGVIWAQSSMMLVWNFAYNLSVGPVCFVVLCECSATKVRSKTIAIATATQAIFGIVMTVAIPHMINPDAGNMRGKVGFFFGVSLRFVVSCFYLFSYSKVRHVLICKSGALNYLSCMDTVSSSRNKR